MQCEICGKEIVKSSYSGAVICSSECFGINYWRQIVAEKEQHIIIDGCCYCDGGDRPHARYTSDLGCSGRRFYIRFLDGKEITTNNLWVQGDVPAEFREQLCDNAVFYSPTTELRGGARH